MADAPKAREEADASLPAEAAAAAEAGKSETVELFSGASLVASDAEAITVRSKAHLIVFAGTEGSGKTTILTSVYERLSRGPFAGFLFAGSRSLLGFEEICHLNRLASGQVRPDTQRTLLSNETRYYHLALRGMEPPAARRDVFLSAMSGELFRMAKDSQEEAERLTFLRRADTIVVLVDGERLANPAQRTSAQTDAADILESMLTASTVSPYSRIEFAFSKLDHLTAAGQVALDFLSKTQDKFEKRFLSRVPHLMFRKIAARPAQPSSQSSDDGGMAEAFSSWTKIVQQAPSDENEDTATPSRDDREFSKLGWRHFERIRRSP